MLKYVKNDRVIMDMIADGVLSGDINIEEGFTDAADDFILLGDFEFVELIKDNRVSKNVEQALRNFKFITNKAKNQNSEYWAGTNITLYDKVFFVDTPDIYDEGDLKEALLERNVMDVSYFDNEEERDFAVDLMIEIVRVYYTLVDSLSIDIDDQGCVDVSMLI